MPAVHCGPPGFTIEIGHVALARESVLLRMAARSGDRRPFHRSRSARLGAAPRSQGFGSIVPGVTVDGAGFIAKNRKDGLTGTNQATTL